MTQAEADTNHRERSPDTDRKAEGSTDGRIGATFGGNRPRAPGMLFRNGDSRLRSPRVTHGLSVRHGVYTTNLEFRADVWLGDS